jgi:hypothetical protein
MISLSGLREYKKLRYNEEQIKKGIKKFYYYLNIGN